MTYCHHANNKGANSSNNDSKALTWRKFTEFGRGLKGVLPRLGVKLPRPESMSQAPKWSQAWAETGYGTGLAGLVGYFPETGHNAQCDLMTLHYSSTNGESQVEEPKKDWATGSAEHMVQMSKFMDGTNGHGMTSLRRAERNISRLFSKWKFSNHDAKQVSGPE